MMRLSRLLIAYIFALAILLPACSKEGGEWREMSVAEGGFSVLMRGQPTYVSQPVDTPGGRVTGHLYSSDRPDGFYAVGYSDYPLAYAMSANANELLTGVRDTWIRRLDGKLTRSSERKLNDQYSGIEFAVEGRVKERDTYLQARLYLVDQRLYQLIAMGPKGEVSQGALNRFLDSFKLIPTGGARLEVVPPPGVK